MFVARNRKLKRYINCFLFIDNLLLLFYGRSRQPRTTRRSIDHKSTRKSATPALHEENICIFIRTCDACEFQ